MKTITLDAKINDILGKPYMTKDKTFKIGEVLTTMLNNTKIDERLTILPLVRKLNVESVLEGVPASTADLTDEDIELLKKVIKEDEAFIANIFKATVLEMVS